MQPLEQVPTGSRARMLSLSCDYRLQEEQVSATKEKDSLPGKTLTIKKPQLSQLHLSISLWQFAFLLPRVFLHKSIRKVHMHCTTSSHETYCQHRKRHQHLRIALYVKVVSLQPLSALCANMNICMTKDA